MKHDRLKLPRSAPQVTEGDFADWYYKPHTLAAGIGAAAAVLWLAVSKPPDDPDSNIKHGVLAATIAFLVFGAVHLPDGVIVRPHPAVWRTVLAVALLYLMFVIFMSFQDLRTVRRIFEFYDSSLATPLPEASYATDCRMSTPEDPHKFWNTVADVFLIAHLLGYWAKTLVLRDWRVVTALSLGFEVMEVTFQHVLPNFAECWWDHLLVDVLICNGGGTVLGILTLRWLKAKEYHWVKLTDIPTIRGKAKRVFRQFTPRDGLIAYQWNVFQSPKRFLQVLFVLAVMLLQEMNCFMLKSILNMPPPYHLNPVRLVMWALIAVPGIREFYDYVSEPTIKRLGTTAWVGGLTLCFETVWIAKMAVEGGYFRASTPPQVWLPWAYASVAGISWFSLYFGLPRRMQPLGIRALLAVLYYSIPLAFVLQFVTVNRDLEWWREEIEYAVGTLRL